MARKIAEFDPYLRTVVFAGGITEENVDEFFGGDGSATVRCCTASWAGWMSTGSRRCGPPRNYSRTSSHSPHPTGGQAAPGVRSERPAPACPEALMRPRLIETASRDLRRSPFPRAISACGRCRCGAARKCSPGGLAV